MKDWADKIKHNGNGSVDKILSSINGWGVLLRFIMPILLSIGLFILSDMKIEIRDIKQTAKEVAFQTIQYNTNHLDHHSKFEKEICERITSLEALIKKLR